VTASNGRYALDVMAENTTIELVIPDVMMSEMDGLELLKGSRTHPLTLICLLLCARFFAIKIVLEKLLS
jgi:YesN/AraC family two-component response regulator